MVQRAMKEKKGENMSKARKFGSRKGATFIEYALLAGLVAIVVAAAAMIFGEDLKELFGSTGDQTKNVSESVKKVDLQDTFKDKGGDQGGGGEKN